MKFLVYLILSVSLINFVYSYGLASSYLDNNVMILKPGEEREYRVEIQNTKGEMMKVHFNFESDIAYVKNPKEYYEVGGDKPSEEIIIIVKMPADAKPGDEYYVKYSTVPMTQADSGVGLNIVLNNEFKVIGKFTGIPEEPKEKGTKFMLYGLIIAVSIAVVLLIYRKNKLLTSRYLR